MGGGSEEAAATEHHEDIAGRDLGHEEAAGSRRPVPTVGTEAIAFVRLRHL